MAHLEHLEVSAGPGDDLDGVEWRRRWHHEGLGGLTWAGRGLPSNCLLLNMG